MDARTELKEKENGLALRLDIGPLWTALTLVRRWPYTP